MGTPHMHSFRAGHSSLALWCRILLELRISFFGVPAVGRSQRPQATHEPLEIQLTLHGRESLFVDGIDPFCTLESDSTACQATSSWGKVRFFQRSVQAARL